MEVRSQLTRGSLLLLCLVAAVGYGSQAWYLTRHDQQGSFEPSVRSVEHPVPSSRRCAECHADVCASHAASPHGNTLNDVENPRIRERFAGRSFAVSTGGPVVAFGERGGELWMESPAAPEGLRVDWMFGSGRHAMTPVALATNANGKTELIEGSVSWYSSDVLGLTPGATPSSSGMGCLGTPQDHATTLECFGCHVSSLRLKDGKLAGDQIQRGVSCDRCHPQGEEHQRAMETGQPDPALKWSALTPLESVNRCGECHRRADQLTKDELLPERTVLVRFASVGLVMSRCFQGQEQVPSHEKSRRLDCLTCHDPHQAATKSPDEYVSKCLECHGVTGSSARQCKSPRTARNCLPCHLPGINVTDNLVFTDHWIRVRNSADPPVAESQIMP